MIYPSIVSVVGIFPLLSCLADCYTCPHIQSPLPDCFPTWRESLTSHPDQQFVGYNARFARGVQDRFSVQREQQVTASGESQHANT